MTSVSKDNDSENGVDKATEDAKPQKREVLFRSKKRSRKARTKRLFSEDNEAEGDEQSEMTVSEMVILKEAQELREQSRMAVLTGGNDKRPKIRDSEDTKEDAHDPVGLTQSFAVEKSSHIAEERMSRYIDERMAEKFKDRRKGDDDTRQKPDDDIFAIPDRLKVEEKPLYDPGEGLPAAGVEEVALPDDVRLRNEAETRRAHKEALKKRDATGPNPIKSIPGNLCANFAKHRTNWMQANAARFGDESKHHSKDTEENEDKSVEENMVKRRRYQEASDAVVADRFRKRWKR